MAQRPVPLFLRPASYRARRWRDAARLLPAVGLFFFVLPVLWAPTADMPPAGRRGTASDAIFLFSVWFVLILGAAGIAQSLDASSAEDDPEGHRDHQDRGHENGAGPLRDLSR